VKVIPIGKYRGRLFSDVAVSDPAYLNWMILTFSGEVRRAADLALSYAGAGGKAAGTRPPKRGESRACRTRIGRGAFVTSSEAGAQVMLVPPVRFRSPACSTPWAWVGPGTLHHAMHTVGVDTGSASNLRNRRKSLARSWWGRASGGLDMRTSPSRTPLSGGNPSAGAATLSTEWTSCGSTWYASGSQGHCSCRCVDPAGNSLAAGSFRV
jgi:hypothetical protein